jgi:hypothetical protein
LLSFYPIFCYLRHLWSSYFNSITTTEVVLLLLSCVGAWLTTSSQLLLLGSSSALTFQLLGQFKTVLLIWLGSVVLQEATLPFWQIFGCAIGMLSILCHTYIKVNEKLHTH